MFCVRWTVALRRKVRSPAKLPVTRPLMAVIFPRGRSWIFSPPADLPVPTSVAGEETGSFGSLPYGSRGASHWQAEAQLSGGAAQIVAQDPLASAELISRLYEQPMLSAPAFSPGGITIGMCRSPALTWAFPDVSSCKVQEGFLGQIPPSAMRPAADPNPWSGPIHHGQRADFGAAIPELGRAPNVVAQARFVSDDVRQSAVFLQEPGAQIDHSSTPCGNPARHFYHAEEQAVAAYDIAAIMARISCLIQSHRGRLWIFFPAGGFTGPEVYGL